MYRLGYIAGLLMAMLAAAPDAFALAPVCEPDDPALYEKIKQLRGARQYQKAFDLAQSALAKAPQSVRALYARGLVELDWSLSSDREVRRKSGMDDLKNAAQKIDEVARKNDTAAIACLKEQGVFSIMNTLGYYQTAGNDLAGAKASFLKSAEWAGRGLLNDDTKRKTYGNLGILYFSVGDAAHAKTYLSQAVAAGNKNPLIPQQLKMIETLK
jgi:hypothetical protein